MIFKLNSYLPIALIVCFTVVTFVNSKPTTSGLEAPEKEDGNRCVEICDKDGNCSKTCHSDALPVDEYQWINGYERRKRSILPSKSSESAPEIKDYMSVCSDKCEWQTGKCRIFCCSGSWTSFGGCYTTGWCNFERNCKSKK